MKNKTIYIVGGLVFLAIILLLLFFFFHSNTSTGTPSTGFFGIGGNVSTTQTNVGDSTTPGQVGNQVLQRVFKIADGPVAGATFVQTSNPTTTIARYVMQDTGHISDLAVDVPGAAVRPISNVTIPGLTEVLWGNHGTSTILQYVELGVIKSVYVTFTPATSTNAAIPPRMQFLPNGMESLTVSPDKHSLAYLVTTATGANAFTANIDGTGSKKLFSLPLSQMLLSWPAQNALIAQTKSAAGVPGIAFSINAKTGGLSPLLYTPGLSAIANNTFTKVVYQTNAGSGSAPHTYIHDIEAGRDANILKTPLPEKCVWASTAADTLYCALPLDTQPQNYIDLWHQGLVQTADSIVEFDANSGGGVVVTLPGNGGPSAPIDQLGVSPDGKYLLFITRGDHSLWGVRL
ncbi:MAG: hypothetical protein NT019_01355 [Candidatus Adlerbacteria bacterium]|nr:hypothetical protein [Candidatus Adlerbacteria bacterium]